MGMLNTANARQSRKHEAIYKEYRNRGMREINKAKRAIRTLTRQPLNDTPLAVLKRIPRHQVDLAIKMMRRDKYREDMLLFVLESIR